MKEELLVFKTTGLYTTFQDKGRYGYQRYGVVTSGAMDLFALQAANVLVGNPLHTSCIEICMVGPSLTFLTSVTFSICGANLSPCLNNMPISNWRTYKVKHGDTLTFGKQIEGNYAYLAVKGGFDIEEIMGSNSTYPKAGLGQLILKNSVVFGKAHPPLRHNRGLSHTSIPKYEENLTVRYIPGPHLSYLQQNSNSCFEDQTYTFEQGDRMGYRFKGEKAINHANTSSTLPSDPIPLGGIQIPPDGNPIVLLADRQTTGGYPRIGTIVAADLPKLVQLPIRGIIKFKSVTIEESQNVYKEAQKKLFIWSHC
jgi:antagonist of KipI